MHAHILMYSQEHVVIYTYSIHAFKYMLYSLLWCFLILLLLYHAPLLSTCKVDQVCASSLYFCINF